MQEILIARHGNTFDTGDTITRVGLKTDLALSISGKEQAMKLGLYLKSHHPSLGTVFTSELIRTIQTAEIALASYPRSLSIKQCSLFNEIDYGVDENKPEEEVIARLGATSIAKWDNEGILPNGWHLDIDKLKESLSLFLQSQAREKSPSSLIITSNGIARFFPMLSEVESNNLLTLKMPTGSLSRLVLKGKSWQIDFWGKKL